MVKFRVVRRVKNRFVYGATANQYNIYDGGGVDGCKRAALDGSVSRVLAESYSENDDRYRFEVDISQINSGKPSCARNQLRGIMSVRVPQDPPSSCTLRLLSPFAGHCHLPLSRLSASLSFPYLSFYRPYHPENRYCPRLERNVVHN